ncbi:hypothetical protein GCM10007423_63930 [Dyadobacter endophyticus]|uniref:Uncharacterized protein n=1 Tax=Dyadobacter endophyticus TaxID=1749036 RepID=A0ABQ1ZD52_9BACT|nr:hypothetical protein [Dyadobacter endophyticus]GGH55899.1 hypothetical protein GCM10007423_63930 [Dyadobacter endophyticus]
MDTPEYKNRLPEEFTSWTHFYHSMRLWTPLTMSSKTGDNLEMSFVISERNEGIKNNGLIKLDVDFLKARLFEEILENCEFEVDLAKRVRALAFTHPRHDGFQDWKIHRLIKGIIYLSSLRYDHDSQKLPDFLDI